MKTRLKKAEVIYVQVLKNRKSIKCRVDIYAGHGQ